MRDSDVFNVYNLELFNLLNSLQFKCVGCMRNSENPTFLIWEFENDPLLREIVITYNKLQKLKSKAREQHKIY